MNSDYNPLVATSSISQYPSPTRIYHAGFFIPSQVELPSVYRGPIMELPLDPNYKGMSPDSTTTDMFSFSGMCGTDSAASLKLKNKRPFKNLPKNSMELALKCASTESVCTGMGATSALAYAQYRQQCLRQLKSTNSELNKNMRRILTSKTDDPEYLEKRRRNNEAAKKSRESRKVKEDELAIRVSFLEQENLTLKVRLAEMEKEKNMLQTMLYYR